ncbi:MAG: hypothetical protein OEY49_10720 [Candidatus Heimdallarchaeota archaeon]|nr:hypothetical protein [Candidatus Heimdallarchaeota archaeon]
MAESLTEVMVKVVQIIIVCIILIAFMYRKRRINIQPLNWFIWIFALLIVQGIIELIIYFIKTQLLTPEEYPYFKYNELHNIPYGFAVLLIFLFSESLQSKQPHPIRFGVVIAFWGSYISLMFYEIWLVDGLVFSDKTAPQQPFNTLFDIYQLIAMSFVCFVFWKSFRMSRNDQNRLAAFLLFLSLLMINIILIYEIIESFFGLKDIYGAITFGISFLIMAFVYIKYPYYVFSVPHNIYRLIIASKNGLHLYSADINYFEEATSDELLAGGVSAITSFMVEALGSNTSLKYAVMADRALTVRRVDNIVGFIIADKSTHMLSHALDHFVREFTQIYAYEIEHEIFKVTNFKDAAKIIFRCFPFVEASDIIQIRVGMKEQISKYATAL